MREEYNECCENNKKKHSIRLFNFGNTANTPFHLIEISVEEFLELLKN